jgi:hypothetical protein
MNIQKKLSLVIALAGLATAACTETQSVMESDYGNALRQVTAASSANPAAHANPSAALVESGDAETLNSSVTNMRKAATKATEDVKRDIVINVGGK